MEALTKTTIVIMLALSAQAAGFARRLRSPAGNMCNIRGSSGVYHNRMNTGVGLTTNIECEEIQFFARILGI